jgi:hypothetical protein
MVADVLLLLVVILDCFWTACVHSLLTGLLPVLAESCTHIAAAVRLATNEHLLPYMLLATALISLWGQVVLQWPDRQQQQQQQQHILPSQLQLTLQPAIALAAAILSTAGPAATAAVAAASTAADAIRSDTSLIDDKTLRKELLGYSTPREASDYAVRAADVIVGSVMSWLGKLAGTPEQQQRQLAPLLSQDLLLLVTTRFAYECVQLYRLTDGASPWVYDSSSSNTSSSSSSSSRRRPAQQQQYLQVPPYHKQLLSCLGVITSEQLPGLLQQRSTMSLDHAQSMKLLTRLLRKDLSLPPQQQQQLKLKDSQVAPLLLCCVEAALLAPGPCKDVPSELLASAANLCLVSSMQAVSAVIAAGIDEVARLPARLSVQVTEQFAGPMLQLLTPAVRQSLRLAVGKQQQAELEQAEIHPRTSELWGHLVYWVAAAGGVCCQSCLSK